MSTTDLIKDLQREADRVIDKDWSLGITLLRAAAMIEILRGELKYILDKEREI